MPPPTGPRSSIPKESQTTHTPPLFQKGKEVGDSGGIASQKATEEADHFVLLWLPLLENFTTPNLTPVPPSSPHTRAALLLVAHGWEEMLFTHQVSAGVEGKGLVRWANPPSWGHCLPWSSPLASVTLIFINNLTFFFMINCPSQLQLARSVKLQDLHSVKYLDICQVPNLMRPWKVFSALTLSRFHEHKSQKPSCWLEMVSSSRQTCLCPLTVHALHVDTAPSNT